MDTIIAPCGPIRTGWLLLDTSNLDDGTFAEAPPMLRCTPAALTQSDALMPCLIDVAALPPAQQDGLGEILLRELSGCRPPAVCAWLDCAPGIDADALARHLTRYLVGPGSGGAAVFWRYFDPRVFALAMHLFSTDQAAALIGPVVAWRFPWCRRWWSVSGSGREADPLQGVKPAWPGAEQWRSLDHSDLLARVLSKMIDLHESAGPPTNSTCLRWQRNIDAAMLFAKLKLGMTDKDDLAEYALHCVRYGEAFRRHPKLASAWTELAQGRGNWSELVATLDHTDYQLLDEDAQLQAIF
jgi:hypothetical protein